MALAVQGYFNALFGAITTLINEHTNVIKRLTEFIDRVFAVPPPPPSDCYRSSQALFRAIFKQEIDWSNDNYKA